MQISNTTTTYNSKQNNEQTMQINWLEKFIDYSRKHYIRLSSTDSILCEKVQIYNWLFTVQHIGYHLKMWIPTKQRMSSVRHFCSRSADARAILTPKDAKLCCMFSSFLGRVSRDYFICLSVIINYDFDLSVFIFPKSGVKISAFLHLEKIEWKRYDKALSCT